MGTHLNLVKRQSVYHLDRKIQFSWSVFNLLFANVSECLHKSSHPTALKLIQGAPGNYSDLTLLEIVLTIDKLKAIFT